MGFLDIFKSFQVVRNRDGKFEFFSSNVDDFGSCKSYLTQSLENPVLFSIMALRSKMVSQMKIIHLDKNGNILEKSPITQLIAAPNYFQTQEDFIFQMCWFMGAVGTNYVYQIKPYTTLMAKALYNLYPESITTDGKMKVDSFIWQDSQIQEINQRTIKYKIGKKEIQIAIGDLIPMYDVANGLTPDSLLESPSRVKAIQKPLQNIEEALKSKNINLKMSAKYLGSNKNTINGMPSIIDEKDRKAIESVMTSKNVLLTNNDINFQHLVRDLKNLELNKSISDDAQLCLLAYGLNNDVLNFFSGNSSTYANQEKGELRAFQNEISQIANNICRSFTSTFGLDKKGEKLIASFDHLPIMQAVMVDKINTFKAQQDALATALTNGTITVAEATLQTNKLLEKLGLTVKN